MKVSSFKNKVELFDSSFLFKLEVISHNEINNFFWESETLTKNIKQWLPSFFYVYLRVTSMVTTSLWLFVDTKGYPSLQDLVFIHI